MFYFLSVDSTLPSECYPVVIFKKTTAAVPQTYNLPVPGEESFTTNLFECRADLLTILTFPGDSVLDTSLDGKYFSIPIM